MSSEPSNACSPRNRNSDTRPYKGRDRTVGSTGYPRQTTHAVLLRGRAAIVVRSARSAHGSGWSRGKEHRKSSEVRARAATPNACVDSQGPGPGRGRQECRRAGGCARGPGHGPRQPGGQGAVTARKALAESGSRSRTSSPRSGAGSTCRPSRRCLTHISSEVFPLRHVPPAACRASAFDVRSHTLCGKDAYHHVMIHL